MGAAANTVRWHQLLRKEKAFLRGQLARRQEARLKAVAPGSGVWSSFYELGEDGWYAGQVFTEGRWNLAIYGEV